ncbi:MAG TPA: radical SAM protein [Methanobacterium sp.]|nr:MAG: radical SAM protein [Methanobacterium sp.]HOI71671.1 radical SAM protein [Methanobacterium sp.]
MKDNGENHPENLIKLALSHYFNILEGKDLSYFHKSSLIPVKDKKFLYDLWEEHEQVRKDFRLNDEFTNLKIPPWKQVKPSFSYMDLKISIAEKLFDECIFCERRCGVNRNDESGFCGVKKSKIASEFLHMGEEAPLIPSHTIFFTGCTFKCVYCQNMDISQHPDQGILYTEDKLAEFMDDRKLEGSRNVNFVGGDPNPHLLYILKAINLIRENIPVIWNSNFYATQEAMYLLDGAVDLYLSDFKYGNDDCAMRLSGISNYWNVVTRNHMIAFESGDMIIRHLLLPGHVECCTFPILDWIYGNLGKEVVLNIMDQYRPLYRAFNHNDISGFLQRQEYVEAVDYARKLGFVNLI